MCTLARIYAHLRSTHLYLHLHLPVHSTCIPHAYHMQADATMAASNRPMFCLSAMSATLRRVRVLLLRVQCRPARGRVRAHAVHMHMHTCTRQADVDPQYSARIDASISVLVDLTGANERIFKSPQSRSNPNPTLSLTLILTHNAGPQSHSCTRGSPLASSPSSW